MSLTNLRLISCPHNLQHARRLHHVPVIVFDSLPSVKKAMITSILDVEPFIFQFPPTKNRRSDVIPEKNAKTHRD